MVEQLEKIIETLLDKALKTKNLSLKGSYLSDTGELYILLDYLKRGDYRLAARKARHLETAVRDYIPREVWDFLLGHMDGI